MNAAWLQRLDFANKQDFEDAKAGFIEGLPDGGVVKNEKGEIVWDPTKFDFIGPDKTCPDTVNPSLWRISQLLPMGGIFKIAPKIYQVRGYDLSVITFIEGKTGVIVVDPLVSAETAAAALKLYRKTAGDKPVVAVVHTHSHVDHFGGVRGVTNDADVKAGKCLIVAPEHFTEEAVSENVLAGNVMSRRIGERIQLPPTLDRNWASRGYYGTVNHDAKAVYNLYLGFFNGNPSTLNEYPPADASKRYVEFMGGADAVLNKAKETFDKGDYRWTAQVVNHVVLADPSNKKARSFLADTLEQLGYQAEGGVWRNFYLAGAKELRDGVMKAATPATSSPDVVRSMPMELFLDYLAIQVNAKKAEGKVASIKLVLPDTKESYFLTLENSVLNAVKSRDGQKSDVTLTIPRSALNNVILGQAKLPALVTEGTAKFEGQQESLMALLGSLEPFEFWFDIITANADKP